MNDERKKVLDNTLHLSTKYTNATVTQKFGVRYSKDSEPRNLPYISVRDILPENEEYWELGLDVVLSSAGAHGKKMVNNKDSLYRECHSELLSNDFDSDNLVGHSMSDEEMECFYAEHIVSDEYLEPNIKQIFLPVDDTYISVTPMESAGFSHILNILSTDYRVPHAAGILVGGNNPVNVSVKSNRRLIQNNVLFFKMPSIDNKIKVLYSYEHKDIYIKVDRGIIKDIQNILDNNEYYSVSTKKSIKVKLYDLMTEVYNCKTVLRNAKKEGYILNSFNSLLLEYDVTTKDILAKQIFTKFSKYFDELNVQQINLLRKLIGEML